jgi:peptidoglycan/xylan/chitin deacetylase (PgdA/CDA1 family)
MRRPLRVLAALALVAGLAYAALRISGAPCFQLVGQAVCRVETSQPLVALSFDDGPTPLGVDALLPVLEAHGVKATFFVIGNEMERHPGLAARLKAAGHELGNHSRSHVRMVGRLPGFHADEIASTDRQLRAAGETNPTLFRPPYGKRLIGLPLALRAAGYRTITWSLDEGPVADATAQAYAAHFVNNARPGDILLIHPMYGPNQTARDALPLILEGLKARGLRPTTVSELLAAEAPHASDDGVRG